MITNELIIPIHNKSSLSLKTGDWRTLKPEFQIKQSVCQANCPLGNNIRTCFQLARNGKLYEAWCKLLETNPLPAVLGRICPRACEEKCLRGEFDETLAINAFEKNLGDLALKYDWHIHLSGDQPLRGKRVAIIGAGPAGLSCAYQLRRFGCRVSVFEAEKVAGGMLYLGIPEYRLSKKLLIQEIGNNILSLGGIEIHYSVTADNLLWHHFPPDFDAVLVAIGRNKSMRLNIPGEERNPKVISGLDFLKKINLGQKADIGAIVAVVGGGNTAIDTGRSAKRNGAKHVFILYRRREEDMPALTEEIKAAEKDGIEIIPLVAPALIEKRSDGLLRIECIRMKLGELDESGRPKPVPVSGSQFIAFAHNIIIAVGEEPDLSFMAGFNEGKFSADNVFVAGDALQFGNGTVAAAVGSGAQAAREINYYLRNIKRHEAAAKAQKIVQFSDLNQEHFEYCRSVLRRYPQNLPETVQIFMQDEASRCFSCGDCNSCGNCWLFCPDLAMKENSEGKYECDYEYCKGCGICANECPRNAIDMVKEVK